MTLRAFIESRIGRRSITSIARDASISRPNLYKVMDGAWPTRETVLGLSKSIGCEPLELLGVILGCAPGPDNCDKEGL